MRPLYRLTAARCSAFKGPGRICDGGSLYLQAVNGRQELGLHLGSAAVSSAPWGSAATATCRWRWRASWQPTAGSSWRAASTRSRPGRRPRLEAPGPSAPG